MQIILGVINVHREAAVAVEFWWWACETVVVDVTSKRLRNEFT